MALPTSPSSGEGQLGFLAIILTPRLAPFRRHAREFLSQVPLRLPAEFPVDAKMRRLLQRRAPHAAMAEMKEVRARETHQQRRVRGDDVLHPTGRALLRQHRHELELALR